MVMLLIYALAAVGFVVIFPRLAAAVLLVAVYLAVLAIGAAAVWLAATWGG